MSLIKEHAAALKNPVFSKIAEGFYQKHLRSMAHTYYDSFLYLEQNPEIRQDLINKYVRMVAQSEGTGDGSLQGKFRKFAEDLEKGSQKANVY